MFHIKWYFPITKIGMLLLYFDLLNWGYCTSSVIAPLSWPLNFALNRTVFFRYALLYYDNFYFYRYAVTWKWITHSWSIPARPVCVKGVDASEAFGLGSWWTWTGHDLPSSFAQERNWTFLYKVIQWERVSSNILVFAKWPQILQNKVKFCFAFEYSSSHHRNFADKIKAWNLKQIIGIKGVRLD